MKLGNERLFFVFVHVGHKSQSVENTKGGSYERTWREVARQAFLGRKRKFLSLSPRRRPKPREKVVYGPARMLPPLSLSLEVSASCIPSSTKTKWPSTPRGVVVRRCAVIVDSLMTRTRTKETTPGFKSLPTLPRRPAYLTYPLSPLAGLERGSSLTTFHAIKIPSLARRRFFSSAHRLHSCERRQQQWLPPPPQ